MGLSVKTGIVNFDVTASAQIVFSSLTVGSVKWSVPADTVEIIESQSASRKGPIRVVLKFDQIVAWRSLAMQPISTYRTTRVTLLESRSHHAHL